MAEAIPAKRLPLGLFALVFFAGGALVASAGLFLGNPAVAFAGRWVAIAGLIAYGLKRNRPG